MFNITASTLVPLLERYKGKKLGHLDTMTIPELTKKGRVTGMTIQQKFGVEPGSIRKYSSFGCGVGYEYAALVEGRLEKDGKCPEDYIPGISWHMPYNGSTVIRVNKNNPDGAKYVFVALIANNPARAEYRSGNTLIPTDELKEFLKLEYEAKNQGLEKERQIKVITLKLESITRLAADGAEYIIE
jgi:hypothetical protein